MSFWGFVMRRRAALVALALCVAGLPAIGVGLGAQPAGAAGGTRQISAGGTGRLVSPAFGSGAVQFPEFSAQESEEEPTPGVGPDVDRGELGRQRHRRIRHQRQEGEVESGVGRRASTG